MAPDYNETPYEIPQESLRKDGFSTLQFPPELVYEPTAGANIYASPDPLTGNGVRDIDGRFIDFYMQPITQESKFLYELPQDIYKQVSTSMTQ